MAKGKADRTKEESQIQKHRTAKNQIKRYKKLIEDRPNDIHAKVWITTLVKHESALN